MGTRPECIYSVGDMGRIEGVVGLGPGQSCLISGTATPLPVSLLCSEYCELPGIVDAERQRG